MRPFPTKSYSHVYTYPAEWPRRSHLISVNSVSFFQNEKNNWLMELSIWHIIGIVRISQQTSWLPISLFSCFPACALFPGCPTSPLSCLNIDLYTNDVVSSQSLATLHDPSWANAWGYPSESQCCVARQQHRIGGSTQSIQTDNEGARNHRYWGQCWATPQRPHQYSLGWDPEIMGPELMWNGLKWSDNLVSIAQWTRTWILKMDCLGFKLALLFSEFIT